MTREEKMNEIVGIEILRSLDNEKAFVSIFFFKAREEIPLGFVGRSEAIQLLRDLENITEKLTRYVNGDTAKEAV